MHACRLLVATLLPNSDRVLQLTAAMTLERFAMDQAFEAVDFSPLLGVSTPVHPVVPNCTCMANGTPLWRAS